MKKIRKRILSFFCILCIMLLTACGDAKTGSEVSGSGEKADFDEESMKIVLNNDENYGKSASMYEDLEGSTFRFLTFENLTQDSLTAVVLDAFAEEYGVKVEIEKHNWSEWGTRIYQMVASGDAPDTIWLSDGNWLPFVTRNVVSPVDDYIDFSDSIWNKETMDMMSWAGKHYALIPGNGADCYYIYYNKDLFEDLNIEDPLEMWEEGRWTFETFRETAKKFVADTNGDGVKDRAGFTCWNMDIFAVANNGPGVVINDDGTMTATLDRENEQVGYQLYQDMVYVDKSMGGVGQDATVAFQNGKIAMFSERSWNALGATDMWDKCDFEIGVVPFPVGPNVEEGKTVAPCTITAWGISACAKNPKAAAAYYHFKAKWTNENYTHKAYVAEIYDTYRTFDFFKWHQDFKNSPNTIFVNCALQSLPQWDSKRAPFLADIQQGIPAATATKTHIGIVQEGINTIMAAMKDKK